MLMQFLTTSYTYVPYMDGQLDIRYVIQNFPPKLV